MAGWENHVEPIKDTRRRMGRMTMRQCPSQGLWIVGILRQLTA